jgi:uncharacterized protein YecE (DUF72 family)
LPSRSRPTPIRVATAGWALPRTVRDQFPEGASNLARYAGLLPAAEINSSFYRPHKPATYARWAASVPESFRFAVKVPKLITHTRRLADPGEALDAFLAEVAGLGARLGCLLVQLPPSLAFDPAVVDAFLGALRERHAGAAAVEARHASWFTPAAETLLSAREVARVAADPPRAPGDGEPGGWPRLAYYRLHGSPRVYWSAYDEAYLEALASRLTSEAAAGRDVWCVFDNTASGAAAANALDLRRMLAARPARKLRV